MFEESRQGAVVWRSCVERDVFAQVVSSLFAVRTAAAWDTGLDGNNVTRLEVSYAVTHFVNLSTSLVSQDHRTVDDEGPDPPVAPVMDIGSADTDRKTFKDDLCVSNCMLRGCQTENCSSYHFCLDWKE